MGETHSVIPFAIMLSPLGHLELLRRNDVVVVKRTTKATSHLSPRAFGTPDTDDLQIADALDDKDAAATTNDPVVQQHMGVRL